MNTRILLPLVAAFCLAACSSAPEVSNPESSSIAISADDATLLIASEDHGELLIVDAATKDLEARIPVGAGASHVIAHPSGRAVVSARYAHTVSVVDLDEQRVIQQVTVGSEPTGMSLIDDATVAVALSGERAVALVDLNSGAVSRRFDLPGKDPRAVAWADGKLFVAYLTQTWATEIDLDSGAMDRVRLDTPTETSHPLTPNLFRSVTVVPDADGERLVFAHSQNNSHKVRSSILVDGEFEDEEEFFEDEFGGCGYGGCGGDPGAVVPAITEVDTAQKQVVVPVADNGRNGFGRGGRSVVMEDDMALIEPGGEFFGVLPPSVLSPFDNRFGFAGFAPHNPTAIAVLDKGRMQAVVNLGSGDVHFLHRPMTGQMDDLIGSARVGQGAEGLVASSDGSRLYVFNRFDGSVTEIAVPDRPSRNSTAGPGRFRGGFPVATAGNIPSETTALVTQVLSPEEAQGRILFHDATDPAMTLTGTISCGSCHPDGRSDNQVWRFDFGDRNTPPLAGGILDTAPFHWPGDVSDFHDLNNATVLPFMGGEGVTRSDMELIMAFVDGLPAAPAPNAANPQPTPAQERGKAVFESAETACATCHAGPDFTDNLSYDIGSRSGSDNIRYFQVPVLHGLARSAPYMHDGSASDLEELVEDWVRTDRMGVGSHLSDQEAADLVEYLKTL